MSEVLADPKIVERLGELGFVTKAMTPAEFTTFVADQVKTFQAPVKASGANPSQARRQRRIMQGIDFGADYKVRLPDRFNVAVPFIDRHLAEGRGAKAAIRTVHGEAVTFGELAERVNRAGNALLARGLKPGDRLLMVVKDCPAFFYLFWGAIKAGIVPVPPNTLLRAADYAYMFEDSGCGLVVYSTEFAGEIEPALKQFPVKALTVDAFLAEMEKASAGLEARLAAPTDDCFWLYSSGSTGRPKGAVHVHHDMVVTSELYGVRVLGVTREGHLLLRGQAVLRLRPGQRHDLPAVDRQHGVLDDRRPTPDTIFEMIERTSRRSSSACRRSMPRCWSRSTPSSATLDSIRACVSAGEPLPADIFRRWKEKTGTVILDGIGSTECLHIFIGNRPTTTVPAPAASRCRATRRGGRRRRPAGERGRDRQRCGSAAESTASTTGTSPRRPPRPWSTAG